MVVQEKREEVHSVISRSVDQWENQQKPKVTLSDSQISFVNTAMDTPVSQTFFIENSGQVMSKPKFLCLAIIFFAALCV